MATAEILSLISTISFVIAVISFVLAVLFWFAFKIPAVIGDLSGRTARKSIAKMRASNERGAGKGYKPSATNVSRGKTTDPMRDSRKVKADPLGKIPEQPAGEATGMPETGLLATNKADVTDAQHTELLADQDVTGLLVADEATEMLHDESKRIRRTGGKKLTMLEEVMLIHTDEVID